MCGSCTSHRSRVCAQTWSNDPWRYGLLAGTVYGSYTFQGITHFIGANSADDPHGTVNPRESCTDEMEGKYRFHETVMHVFPLGFGSLNSQKISPTIL